MFGDAKAIAAATRHEISVNDNALIPF